jgi:hypothetical protein
VSLQNVLADFHDHLLGKHDEWQQGLITSASLHSPMKVRQAASAEACLRALGDSSAALVEVLENEDGIWSSPGSPCTCQVASSPRRTGHSHAPRLQQLGSRTSASIAWVCDILSASTDAVEVLSRGGFLTVTPHLLVDM